MNDARVAELVEQAFEYRGYVTIRRRDGSELVGYVYDRTAAHVELLDESALNRTRLARDEIEDIRFTGDDPVKRSNEVWERRKGRLEPKETPSHGEWQDARAVLLLVALDQELRHVANALGLTVRGSAARGRVQEADVVVRAVGVGGGAARAVADEEPRMVVSCGFCGALDARLAPGDLVLATSVRDDGGHSIVAPPALLEVARRALSGLPFSEGPLLCTTAVAAGASEKRALAGTSALAVEMEAHPVARAAVEAGIPWLALRAVVDSLDATLPPFAREPRDGYVLPALRYALGGPKKVLELVRLGRDARSAGRALEAALRRLGPALVREVPA